MANYVVAYGLYDADGRWVADVGKSWSLEPHWYVLSMAAGAIPDHLRGPFGDLERLETVLRDALATPES